MSKRSKNDAKIDIISVFQGGVLKAVFMEIRVFLQENKGFLGCGVSKKSQKRTKMMFEMDACETS